MNRFFTLADELKEFGNHKPLVEAKTNANSKEKALEIARNKAQFRVQKAFLQLRGLHPDHGHRDRHEGLRLAKKLIDSKINNIDIVVDTLEKMHTVLFSKNRITLKHSSQYCKLWGAYYSDEDRLIHICPSFFKSTPEQQIRTLIHESAHAAGIGKLKQESYLPVYDCQTSYDDFNVADAWAHFVHCLLNLPPDSPHKITGKAQAQSTLNGNQAEKTIVLPEVIKPKEEDSFIAEVLNFIFEDTLVAKQLNKQLRKIAAEALWDLIKAANLESHFPMPPGQIPSPTWLILNETQTAFHKLLDNHSFPQAIRKTIKLKWQHAYKLAKMKLASQMAANFTSDKLKWTGSTKEQLAFMRKVYDINYKRSAQRKSPHDDVPSAELEEVESGYKLRKSAAQSFKKLLQAARAAIKAAGVNVKIGISSAYRSPSHQFSLWQQYFPDYYNRTKAERQNMEGGEHSDKAAQFLARYARVRIASPGFSNHNNGLAVDIKNTENGQLHTNKTKNQEIVKWKASWLWEWLVNNADSYYFVQEKNINEPWHWVYVGKVESKSYYKPANKVDAMATQLCHQYSRSEIFTLIDALSGWVEQHTTPTVSFNSSVGQNGTNKTKDVQSLKQRLYDLGFDWLTLNGKMDKETIRTIKLFQSIVRGKNQLGGDGRVDVTGTNTPTYDWLKASNAPKWKQIPSSGKGFLDTDRAASNKADGKVLMNWGTNWLIDTIIAAGANYEDDYRKGNTAIAPIHTNDLSLRKGGDTKDHKGHETGLMVDLRLPRTDKRVGGVRWDSKFNLYDQNAARAIIKAFRNQSLFETCYFNDSKLIEEGLCKWSKGHDDHIHIKVKPPTKK